MKAAIKRAIQRAGLEPAARAARTAMGGRVVRRDARDGRHLSMLLAFVLRPDSSCVDVGAHVGGVLGEFVRLAPRGHHVAFEPIPQLAVDLRRRFPNVEIHASAVAAEQGTATFEWVKTRPAVSGLQHTNAGEGQQVEQITVPVVCLDDCLSGPPDVIKIDVEGGEEAVLRGATDALNTKPLVIFEHGRSAAAYGTKSETIFDLLSDAGLRVFDLDGGGPYTVDRFTESVASDERWNYVAH